MDAATITRIVATTLEHSENGDYGEAWLAAQPLLSVQAAETDPADALAQLIRRGAFEREQALLVAQALADSHPRRLEVLTRLGNASEVLHDLRYLNAAPPSHPLFAQVTAALRAALDSGTALTRDEELATLCALATIARMLGRTHDQLAERCYLRRIELEPELWTHHYDYGLFLKTRARFREGVAANRRAFELGGAEDEAVRWNLGICATGAGDSATALEMWKTIGHDIPVGRFDLPDGPYDSVKVRIAERPLAERDPNHDPDDPGLEETIWIERLSPCHGVIRSGTYNPIGVDFGDVILFDGAPITEHEYSGGKVPVFPHLVTLVRAGYLIVPFGGTQAHAEQVAELSKALPDDAVLYVHSEQVQVLCSHCWESGLVSSGKHRQKKHHVVTGKLCAPPSLSPRELLAIIDAAVKAEKGVQLLIPDLAAAVGDAQRAEVEGRRLEMIWAAE